MNHRCIDPWLGCCRACSTASYLLTRLNFNKGSTNPLPVCAAAIGKLSDTIVDRSITIEMARKRPDEKVKRLRSRDGGELLNLGRKAARWADDHCEILERANPEVPEQLHDRAADAWSPLLAISDVAGDEWSARARKAAVELCGSDDSETVREMLLKDIRDAFDASEADRIASDDLVAHLTALDHRPWSEINRGKPLSKTSLARMLKPFKVVSGSIRLDDGRNLKGYLRSAFDDVFGRYIPSMLLQSVTTSQARESAAFGGNQNVTDGNDVTFQKLEDSRISADCDVVTDDKPVSLEEITVWTG